jgi:hypothetical protein
MVAGASGPDEGKAGDREDDYDGDNDHGNSGDTINDFRK